MGVLVGRPRKRPDLRQPAGAPDGGSCRARPRRDPRFGAAGPHRQGRYRAELGSTLRRRSRCRPPQRPVFAKAQMLALAGNPPYSEKPHSAMRRIIARRLTESKQTVPHFYETIDCEIDDLLKIRDDAQRQVRTPTSRSTISSSAPRRWRCARCRRPTRRGATTRSSSGSASTSRSRSRSMTG